MLDHLHPPARLARACAGALALLATAALPAAAQMIPIPEDLRAQSPFNLTARGDFGATGFRVSGAATWCVTNVAGMPAPRLVGCREPRLFNTQFGTRFMSFEWPFIIAAPRSDVPDGINPDDLVGGGYTFTTNAVLATRREELLASDRSGRDLLALGIVATEDGSCRDHRGFLNGDVFVGVQLLPHTGCPPTWPDPQNWGGARRITLEGFLAAQPIINPTGREDPFAFWRVPRELQTTRPLGDQATYGEFVDWSADLLARYPRAIPGGGGQAPLLRGWPLGLTVRFDAFYFNLPTVNNAFFVQYLIINDSEKVYGRPVDYDSIYIGTQRSPGSGQFQSFFVDLPRGAWYARNCTQNIPTAKPSPYSGGPSSVACTPGGGGGFTQGAQGLMVLKSPIGDLRNKLLTNPTSPFYNPNHPNRGDTITFNHSHGCGFITCSSFTLDYSERSAFGMMSSTLVNVLDGRPRTEFTDATYFNSIHPSEVWPERGDFNKYVPGVHDNKPVWDYNHDGKPDTIYVDTCGSKGCVPLWQDTVPGGWFNRFGQTAPMSIGPFSLKAGDTTALVIAYFADRDSASFEATAQNVYDFYLSFFFGPEAAPAPDIKAAAVGVTGGAQDSTQIRLNWNDAARTFVDPFLLKLASDMQNAGPTTTLGKIRDLNPGIVDSLRNRARANVLRLYVFRSCDGGQTFTDDGDCLPDRVDAADNTSKWAGIGWLPWATLEPDVNSIADNDVVGGLSYLYSIVTETRGARFRILLDEGAGPVPRDGSGRPYCDPTRCRATEFEFAPSILSPLNKTPDARGVTSVYVPLSRRAGLLAARAEVQSNVGDALVPFAVNLTQGTRNGTFRAIFADTLNVTTVVTGRSGPGGRLDTLAVQVTVATSGAQPRTFTASRPLTMRGEVQVSETTATRGDTVVVTQRHRIVSGSTRAVPMLVLETTGNANRPILATGVLAAGRTTPGAFVDRPDFPGFFLDVRADQGTQFGRQRYFTPRGDSLRNDIVGTNAIAWQTGSSAPLAGVYGKYTISWVDRPYGPGERFVVGSALQDRVTASLNARASAGNSVAHDDSLVARINAALQAAGRPVIPDLRLSPLALPFRIRNETDGRDVQVAVVRHNTTVLLGVGTDTQRVSVPADRWVPGDRLVLLEPMEVVIGGQRVQRLVPTWDVVIGCTATLRETCDATTNSAYAPVVENGSRIEVVYFRPLSPAIEVSITVEGPRPDVASRASDLSRIRVVPNPYIVFSRFERDAAQRIIKFTNLPPEGRIRIYTVAGQFVQELRWTEENLLANAGDLIWDLKTRENTEAAYGLYIWVLDSPAGQARGKFVIIR